MSLFNRCRHIAGVVAVCGMLFPQQYVSAADREVAALPTAAGPQSAVADITLGLGGMLTGRVVDPRGQGVKQCNVWVVAHDRVVSQATADPAGNFRVMGLRGGVYRVVTDNGVRVCRFWNPGTAPPSSRQSVLVVNEEAVTAGQFSPLKCWLADPIVIGAIAAIAIAVPVAVHNARQDRRTGS